ncbi:uncharacterized protein TM35_000641150, partial [Trypanosoma theileri]
MRRVMCVLAVVLCCACGYTMAAAATAVNALQQNVVRERGNPDEWSDLFITATVNHTCTTNPEDTVNGLSCKERGYPKKAEPLPTPQGNGEPGANLSPASPTKG